MHVSANFHLPISNLKMPMSICHFPIPNFHLPSSICQLSIVNILQLEIFEFSLHLSVFLTWARTHGDQLWATKAEVPNDWDWWAYWTWISVKQTWLEPQFCPILPNFAQFCQILPNCAQFCPILPNCCPILPQLLPNFAQFCPIFLN